MSDAAIAVVRDTLALRKSHPQTPALDVLDWVLEERDVWLEDLFVHLVPPQPFALVVAEAFGQSPKHWANLIAEATTAGARQAVEFEFRMAVWLKFCRRYRIALRAPGWEEMFKVGEFQPPPGCTRPGRLPRYADRREQFRLHWFPTSD